MRANLEVISAPKLSIYFGLIILLEAIDFMIFNGRSTLGGLFAIFFILPITFRELQSNKHTVAISLLFIGIILVLNGSIFGAWLKSIYFLTAFLFSVFAARKGMNANYIAVSSGCKGWRPLADNFLRFTFLFLSLDSVTYYLGYRDFILNPNQLGVWSAIYFSFGFLANRIRSHLVVSKINLAFALIALLASSSKGALFLIVVPTVFFGILKFSPRLMGGVALLYIAIVLYLYENVKKIENLAQYIINFKQAYIGGSAEYSDYQRLVEIPFLVIGSMNDYFDVLLGKGLAFEMDYGLYQQIIPHNSFFLLLSHVGWLGMLFLYTSIVYSIYKTRFSSVAVFTSSSLLFVSMTGSPHIARGPLYPLTILLLASLLYNLESEKLKR